MCAQAANTFAPKGVNRTSQIVTTIVPAGKTFPLYQAGNNFYLIVATGVVIIKPNNGSQNEYVQGTGLIVDDLNIFASIQITNNTPQDIVLRIFVGFGNYIDNRLIVYDPSVLQSPHSVLSTLPGGNVVLIPDLSNTAMTGPNGEKFLALNRIALYVSNNDTGVTYNVQNASGSLNLVSVFPLTAIVYPVSGDLSIRVPSGGINAIISEVYNVITSS